MESSLSSSDRKALLTPEGHSLQTTHDGDDIASSSGYSSSQHRRSQTQDGTALSSLASPTTTTTTLMDSSMLATSAMNRKLFVKRGSLTINSMPQQFNYREETAIAATPPIITTPMLERHSQEASSQHHLSTDALSQTAIGNNARDSQQQQHDGDLTSDDMLEDSGDTLASGRQSSSSRTSTVPSWRPWVDTTCCFGYIHLRCTYIFHPQGPLSYFWLFIVSIAVVYNIIQIPLRFAFCGWNMNLGLAATTEDILKSDSDDASSALSAIPAKFPPKDLAFWMVPDYFFDLIYGLDILKSMRTGYFEEGFMNAHPQAIFAHYVGSACFYADVLSLLPLDLLYLSFGLNSLLRIPRIVKIYRCFQFINWTERHTSWPNVVRCTKLFIYVLMLCHWNAALCKTALCGYETIWFSKDSVDKVNLTSTLNQPYNDSGNYTFLSSAKELPHYWAWLYVSVSTLCTLGLSGTSGLAYDGPSFIFIFLTFQMMLGLVLFAVAIGEILLIVDSLGAGRREFQMHLDAVKNYMGKRDIPKPVCVKIIRWFDYIWESKRGFDEERRHLMVLPECLQADISLHAYLHTLKQVEFFRNTEAGFLKELVLKLKPILFSPGEFVCRKGEIGRSMYIIEVGLLQVFSGKHVNTKPVAHLKKGQYFGELSILNMGKAGNRRTATIRSVGYSHLLSLCKDDLLSVLQDFPKERTRLEFFAAKRCEQYHQEKVQEKLKRQQSRETIDQVIVNENQEQSSWPSHNNTPSGSDRANDTMTTVADHRQTMASACSSSSDSDDNVPNNVSHWHDELADDERTPLNPKDFTSECDLAPSPAAEHFDMGQMAGDMVNGRRNSLTNMTAPQKRNTYRARRSNLIAKKISSSPQPPSPLVLRVARSMDIITGRESVL